MIHFMPGRNCLWAGAAVLGIEILIVVSKMTNASLLSSDGGEVKESLIAMFLLVYIVDFSQRTLQGSKDD